MCKSVFHLKNYSPRNYLKIRTLPFYVKSSALSTKFADCVVSHGKKALKYAIKMNFTVISLHRTIIKEFQDKTKQYKFDSLVLDAALRFFAGIDCLGYTIVSRYLIRGRLAKKKKKVEATRLLKSPAQGQCCQSEGLKKSLLFEHGSFSLRKQTSSSRAV